MRLLPPVPRCALLGCCHATQADQLLREAVEGARLQRGGEDLALQVASSELIAEAGLVPVVVTHDVVDRLPLKESLPTACQRLHIETCSLEDLIAWATTPDADRLVMPVQSALDF
jgi:hypothetical protein